MKFLIDQNISSKILNHLHEEFTTSTSIKKSGLINSSDREIWEFAQKKHQYL